MRQGNPVASIKLGKVRLGRGLQSAQAFSVLLQADWVDVVALDVSEPIGGKGWSILAKAIRPGFPRGIFVTRDGLAQGKREDIKHIWDSGCSFLIYQTFEDLQAVNWQASLVLRKVNNDWSRLEQVLEMSEQEFSKEIDGGV